MSYSIWNYSIHYPHFDKSRTLFYHRIIVQVRSIGQCSYQLLYGKFYQFHDNDLLFWTPPLLIFVKVNKVALRVKTILCIDHACSI